MCPPQKLEDFGILILNSRNLVITFTQNSFPFFPLFLSPFSSLFPFLLFSFPFLSFPFSLFLSLFLFPFLFSFSSSFPFLFSLPFTLFSFLSPFFLFPIFALLPDFWCPGGQSAPSAPPLATPLTMSSCEYYTILLHGLIAINRYFTVCRASERMMSKRLTLLLALLCVAPALIIGILISLSSAFNDIHVIDKCGIMYHTKALLTFWGLTVAVTVLLILILSIKIILNIRRRQRSVAALVAANKQQHPRSQNNYQQRLRIQHTEDSHSDGTNLFINEEPVATHKKLHRASELTKVSCNGFPPVNTSMEHGHQLSTITVHQYEPASESKTTENINILHPTVTPVARSATSSFAAESINHHTTPGQIMIARRNNANEFKKRTLLRITKALLLTIAIFALSWVPVFAIIPQTNDKMQNISEKNYYLYLFLIFIRSLPKYNHMINPVIYGFYKY